jgi:Zn-dependent membrane protease YugP
MFSIDPLYFVFLAPGILLGIFAQWRVASAYRRGSQIPTHGGISGSEAASAILHESQVHAVNIEEVPGQLTDHYSPAEKTLRLSPDVYEGRSMAAVGIAAHESGHAIQDARGYQPLVYRNAIVPLANFGSVAGILILVVGFVLSLSAIVYLGIAVFSLTVLFQLVNLPVEFDASRRARQQLVASGIISPEEEPEVAKVLNAAALTYVAATLTAILTLFYYLFRAGAFSRSSND